MGVAKMRRVFITYAHESQDHKVHVLELADELRESGLDAWIDQYDTFPPQGWPNWMLHQIKDADIVLVICSETYRRRFEGHEVRGIGKGAKWEGAIVTQALYDEEQTNRKFVPVVLHSGDADYIPTALRSYTSFDVSDQPGREMLYRFLTDQPSVIPRPLGKLKPLPPTAPKSQAAPSENKQRRVEAGLSFTASASDWALLLKVANISDIALFLENPKLTVRPARTDANASQSEVPLESSSISFLPTKPITGPLLPTQVRDYFLDRNALSLITGDGSSLLGEASIAIATAATEELQLEGEQTTEMVRELLGIPRNEGGQRQFAVRMPLVISLVNKRFTDQIHTTFKVYPPKEVIDDPQILTSGDVIDRLADRKFRIRFEDGRTEELNLAELMVFTYQLIFVAWQMRDMAQQVGKAHVSRPIQGSVQTKISVEQIMHPEHVKILLSKISFESTSSEVEVPRPNSGPTRSARERRSKGAKRRTSARKPKRRKR